MIGEKAKLIQDVKGVKNTTYGLQGETVTVLVDHGQVIIVEDAKGKRFSVCKEHIKCQ